jgi:hypothetical protein
MREIVRHVPSLNAVAKTRIARLVRAEAWTEASLALIEITQPAWKLRRLVCEGGQWLCSLSRQPNLPLAYDNVAESWHEKLPLAVLGALDEAARRGRCSGASELPKGSNGAPPSGTPMCCDNFS